MKISKLRFNVFLGALTAMSIALPQIASAQETFAAKTTIITACGKLFSIDSNAAGLSPERRAAIVQKNLDNALIAAKNRLPASVCVTMMNRNPVVTLDNFYIATADANSASRNNMTQLQLAHKWADSIKMCLADSAMVDKYIAMLTGRYPEQKVKEVSSVATSTDVAVLPWGTTLPVQLSADLLSDAMRLGDPVQAVLSTDIPLGPHFNTYLPAGTLALGHIDDATPFNCNDFAGKHAKTLNFYALQTPDGKQIPINGHIVGGANVWRYVSVNPIQANCCVEKKTEAHISNNQIAFGPNNTLNQVSTTTTTINAPLAQHGCIVGAWRGLPEDQMTQDGFHRLLLTPKTGLEIAAGEPMMLQLSSSSSVAVSTPAPADGIQVSSLSIGM